MRLPPSAPARTAAPKMAILLMRMDNPPEGLPKGSKSTVAGKRPTKIIQASGVACTLIKKAAGRQEFAWARGLFGHQSVTLNRSSLQQKQSGSVGLDEMATTVLLPAGFVVFRTEGLLLTEADGGEAVCRNAERDEILFRGAGATVTEAEVVFGRAALVAVALDCDFELRMALQEIGGLGERCAAIGANICFVVIQIRIADLFEEEFIIGRPFLHDGGRRSIHGDTGGGAGGAAGTRSGDRVDRRIG